MTKRRKGTRKAAAKKATFVVHPPKSYRRFVEAEAKRYARASATFDVARLRFQTVKTDLEGLKALVADAEAKKDAKAGPWLVTSCSTFDPLNPFKTFVGSSTPICRL